MPSNSYCSSNRGKSTCINVIGKHYKENSICLSNSPLSKISGRSRSIGMAAMINLCVYTFGSNVDKMLKTDRGECLNRISPNNMTRFSLPSCCR
uniref:Uncharacterized protein n=1 Tax=Lactuca sativa TaxID=4236 RepID=A0A9R1UKV3_LACSA|nr:hypothetical protein LSAT_V11C900502490 [Lactuca sativa]